MLDQTAALSHGSQTINERRGEQDGSAATLRRADANRGCGAYVRLPAPPGAK